jgi:hypothetical protein
MEGKPAFLEKNPFLLWCLFEIRPGYEVKACLFGAMMMKGMRRKEYISLDEDE